MHPLVPKLHLGTPLSAKLHFATVSTHSARQLSQPSATKNQEPRTSPGFRDLWDIFAVFSPNSCRFLPIHHPLGQIGTAHTPANSRIHEHQPRITRMARMVAIATSSAKSVKSAARLRVIPNHSLVLKMRKNSPRPASPRQRTTLDPLPSIQAPLFTTPTGKVFQSVSSFNRLPFNPVGNHADESSRMNDESNAPRSPETRPR